MKSIAGTNAASPSEQSPGVQALAELLAHPECSRATGTRPALPASKQFETATSMVKFSAEWKGPLRRPRKKCFNDDVRLGAYEPASLSFDDKQSRGAPEAFDGCSSIKEHAKRAVKQPFPMASETPILGARGRLLSLWRKTIHAG